MVQTSLVPQGSYPDRVSQTNEAQIPREGYRLSSELPTVVKFLREITLEYFKRKA